MIVGKTEGNEHTVRCKGYIREYWTKSREDCLHACGAEDEWTEVRLKVHWGGWYTELVFANTTEDKRRMETTETMFARVFEKGKEEMRTEIRQVLGISDSPWGLKVN